MTSTRNGKSIFDFPFRVDELGGNAMKRMRRDQRVYFIDSEGGVRRGLFVRRHGRGAIVRYNRSYWNSEQVYEVLVRRDELFLCEQDAENFARVVRWWLVTPAGAYDADDDLPPPT